jgi:hypothetical protein
MMFKIFKISIALIRLANGAVHSSVAPDLRRWENSEWCHYEGIRIDKQMAEPVPVLGWTVSRDQRYFQDD